MMNLKRHGHLFKKEGGLGEQTTDERGTGAGIRLKFQIKNSQAYRKIGPLDDGLLRRCPGTVISTQGGTCTNRVGSNKPSVLAWHSCLLPPCFIDAQQPELYGD